MTTAVMIQPAYALIVPSTTTLGQNIAVNQSASVSIPWKVVTTGAGAVTSSQAAFAIPGQGQAPSPVVLQLINTPLNGSSFIHAGEAFPSFQSNETVFIPVTIVAKARAAGATQLLYVRSFSDGQQPATVTFLINITGSAGSALSISREALSFTDK